MSYLLEFLIQKAPALAEKTFEQTYLAGLAIFIATALGIPLGIFAVRRLKLKPFILGTSNVLQTIPSLALLAFLLPFLGIGIKPAIVALSLYALLPIVRNTVTGIESISPEIIEAADGLGFTRWQKLRMVELPLALPTIIAGIRTATAMSVGIATLAAFIGGGGLGDFIYQGIALNDDRLVLLGAIPAALLALLLDYFIGTIEKTLATRKIQHREKKLPRAYFALTSLTILLGLLAFKPAFNYWYQEPHDSVTVATKNFTEQFILGYLITDMLESKTHLKVIKKFNLGATDICQNAMIKGDIDIYPEYTGTAYMLILKQSQAEPADQLYQQVKNSYQKQFNMTWLAPFGFNNTQALAVREDFGDQYRLNTISDLVPLAKKLTISVPAEFMERADAFPALKKIYNLQFASIKQMDPGLMYQAIKTNQVDVSMAFSTDARITEYHLKLLNDDKNLFPAYYAAPLIRDETLENHPEIITALQPLAGLINDKTMQQLNYEVDVEKQSPEEVARNFLKAKGLIS